MGGTLRMYAETGLMVSYFQNLSQEVQHLEDFCRSQKTSASMGDLIQTSMISEYDLGGEGDLFKAPEPIIEEPVMGLELDPMTAAISMISCGEDDIPSQTIKVSDIESIQNEQYLSEVFYDCKKDILAKTAPETSLSEVLDIKIPVENQIAEEKQISSEGSFQKSVSSGCLSSMEWINGPAMRPNFLDFDFGVYGMRRAYSDGDIKNLSNGSVSIICSSLERPLVVSSSISEDRREKLSRYRNKKTKRNFGRKIKYACRKALADSQPRIRGRFAKTEESEILKKQ